jgi:hypothetical protein
VAHLAPQAVVQLQVGSGEATARPAGGRLPSLASRQAPSSALCGGSSSESPNRRRPVLTPPKTLSRVCALRWCRTLDEPLVSVHGLTWAKSKIQPVPKLLKQSPIQSYLLSDKPIINLKFLAHKFGGPPKPFYFHGPPSGLVTHGALHQPCVVVSIHRTCD